MRCASASGRVPSWAIAATILAAAGSAAGQEARRRGSRGTETHTVVEGETLAQIARDHRVALSDLLEINDITDPDRIRVGQEIRIPRTAASPGRGSAAGDRDERNDEDAENPAARVTRAGVVVTVERGQTLSDIAHAYGVRVADLERANEIEDANAVRAGRRILVPGAREIVEVARAASSPGASPAASGDGDASAGADRREARVTRRGVVLYVADGQTLSDIANSYEVSVLALARASGIEDANAVRVGQRVFVPGATRVVEVRRVRRDPWAGWSRPIAFHRVHTDEEITVRLFDPRGRVTAQNRRQVDRILRHTPTGRDHRIHPDLLRLIQRVADHWPDREIRIWSAYRPRRRDQYTPRSKHNVGRAVDFTVEGVSNEELRTFCRTLPGAGVGYYPNSRFVHLDARERRAYWVDYSRPGEAPRYGREDAGDAGDEGHANPEARSDREMDESSRRADPGAAEDEGSERLGRELPRGSGGQ